MRAEARAWSDAPFEDGHGHLGHEQPAGAPRPAPRYAPRRAEGQQSEREPSWNVLTEELVSFPRPGRHATLADLTGVHPRGEGAREVRDDAARARRYGEAWLERELVAVRYLADSGYPALERRWAPPGAAPRVSALRSSTPRRRAPAATRLAPAATRHLTDGSAALALPLAFGDGLQWEPEPGRRLQRSGATDPVRRDGHAQAAASCRPHAAIKPRGLRRLLPGVATLAALAGIWAGAGVLASSHARPLAVLPGSVKVPGGYMYVVRPGDTLWSIATRLDPGGDPRSLVAQLAAEVPGGTLQPGARLRLP
ncbi:MAG TPA: LysM peptidoglycan-binding domain-containing protein [Acidimicrobiales bacterium]|nr:LysM peptidoglycan-binding domain-containing protein [Acidimicrobiales bacterium]